MDSLSDLGAVLRSLDGDKITERKKAVEQLRNLLARTAVTEALTQNSEEKHKGKHLTWDCVLKAVIQHVHVESSVLQATKEPVSKASQTTRDRKKKEISSVFKFVIRTAEKSGAHLKTTTLLNHILDIVKGEFTGKAFGADYTSVLLKNILGGRRHWLEIPQKTWHEMLVLYCHMFLEPGSIDRMITARLLRMLMTGAAQQCDLQPKKLIVFFTEVFRKVREQKGTAVMEHITVALSVFAKAIAPNARTQMCKLGETILPGILYLWKNYPSDALKDELVRFLQIQMQAHHPSGARTPESGAFAVEWTTWKNHLKRVYEVIYSDLDQLGGRQKFSSSTRNLTMKDMYIELAADVCYQLYTEESSSIDITQQTGSIQEDSSAPSKKRRLMSGWSALLDTITSAANSPNIVPWLQLLSFVLNKYPNTVLDMGCTVTLQCLHHILTTCKGNETFKLIFCCLSSLARSVHTMILRGEKPDVNNINTLWLQTWTSCLSTISSKQAESGGYQQPGFDLLTVLLQCGLVQPGRQVWNLFLSDVAHPTTSSLSFLAVLLSSSQIPENYKPSILGSSFAAEKGLFPLRKHLLEWAMLTLSRPDSDMTALKKNTSHILAVIVVQLMKRDPYSDSVSRALEQKCFTTDLEEIYLLTTFDCSLDFERQIKDTATVAEGFTGHTIPVMTTALKDAVQEVMHQHLNLTEPEVRTVELVACDCSFLTHYLIQRRRHSLPVSECEILLRQMLEKLTALLNDYVKQVGTSGLLPVFHTLQGMITFPGTSDLACFQTAETLRGCIPNKLINLLFDLVKKKLNRMASSSRGMAHQDQESLPCVYQSNTRRVNNGGSILDDFGTWEVGTREENEMSVDLDELDADAGDSQEKDELLHLGDTGFTSLLDPALLSESQVLRNNIVHFICLLLGNDHHCAPETVVPSVFDVQAVRMKIEDLLGDKNFHPDHPADLQMMDIAVGSLLSPGHHVVDRDLDNIVDVLRRVASVQRQDQQICDLILCHLTQVASYLTVSDSVPTETVQNCRSVLLHLISAFWRLEGSYNSKVRLRLAQCMATVTQCDPHGEWGVLKLRQTDSEGDGAAPSVPDKFPYCLIDGSLSVRLFVSTTVKRLFVVELNGQLLPQSRKQQHAAFDLLYEICNDMIDVKGRMTPEKQQDERTNRTTSLLLTFSCAAMASYVCEKKALLALCLSVHEKNVDIRLVQKILGKMAGALGYPSDNEYLTRHLPFLVSQWLDLKYPLSQFPFMLLCSDISDFYRNHVKLLVSLQFIQQNMTAVSEIVSSLHQEMQETLRECLPEILVHILPVFAVAKSPHLAGNDSRMQQRLATANTCYDLLVEQLNKDIIEKSIKSQLASVVVKIFSCLTLQEPGSVHDQDGRHPESNPPSYSKDVVRTTLDYLTKNFSGNARSLVTVLAKTPDGIEQVLLELCLMLWREHQSRERLRVLQMLQLFVDMLLEELPDTQLGGAWAFVLRRVVTTLLHTLKEHSRERNRWQDFKYPLEITIISLQMLKKVCVAMVECCHQELGNYLCHIVDIACQHAVQHGDLAELALDLLKFLLRDNAALLQEAISCLDPLPNDPVFSELTKLCERIKQKTGKKSFEQIVEQILKATRGVLQPPDSFARTLTCLLHSIDSNKSAVIHLLTHTEESSGICRLICELLWLTQSSNADIAEVAGLCLGAIGPVNLQTFSLQSPQLPAGLSEAIQVYCRSAEEKYCHIFHCLHQYLINQSVDVVEMASVTLKKLLATPAGIRFSADYRDKLANKDYLFKYLQPFRCSKHSRTPPSSGTDVSLQQFFDHIDVLSLWETGGMGHAAWVSRICVALLKSGAVTDPIMALLQPICEAKVEFCEMLLPYLIHNVLAAGQVEHRKVLSHRVNTFFSAHCTLTTAAAALGTSEEKSSSICTNSESVLTMLKVVNYLRTQQRLSQGRKEMTSWDNNFWLDINYLHVALAAQKCAAHFSAILFAEIWFDQQRQRAGQQNCHPCEEFSQDSLLHSLTCVDCGKEHNSVQTLLLEALRCTGDPDAIYGCGAGSLPDAASRVETYLHETQWEKAMVTLDIQMQQSAPDTQLALFTTVQRFGVNYLLQSSLDGLLQSSVCSFPLDISELQYETAWRMGQWDLDIPQRMDKSAPLHHSLYSCLHAVRDMQPQMAVSILSEARRSLLKSFDTHLESCHSLYPLLSRLQCLRQFDLFLTAFTSENRQEDVHTLLDGWQKQQQSAGMNSTQFEFLEPVHSLQLAVVRLLSSMPHQLDVMPTLQNLLLLAAKTARKAGHYQLAERRLHELQHQVQAASLISLHTQLESAQLFWARSEHTTAKHILKSLITKCEQADEDDGDAKRLLPTALGLYGNWLAETRSETPSVIMEQFLEKTVQLLENSGEDDTLEAVEGYLSLARFSDTQYQNIVNYMKSPTFEAKQALMNKASAEYEKYKHVGRPEKDRYLRTLEKQTLIDQQEVTSMRKDRERFLLHAVRCYAQCLQHGDTHDLRVFRLMSLWFDNSAFDNSAQEDINKVMQDCSEKLKSYKFLPLLHQLAARMSTKVKDSQMFSLTLNRILERAALDHPHHTLWVVLALAHANKDEEILAQGRSSKRGCLATSRQDPQKEEDRVQAARGLLEHLKKGSKVAGLVRDMEMLSTAYVQLANWSVPDQQRKETAKALPLPKSLSLMSLKELPGVCVPSLEVPVDVSGCYDNVISIQGYQPTYRLAGGVNLPKIITCRCSDGVDRRQLVKGRDDLRQDAVMQQVFSLVNRLLLSDGETSRRQLHIRTYKVVPLSRRSGLLEWCEGTQPIGEYLIGNASSKTVGAHARFRPQDWSYIDCRKHMINAQQSDANKKYSVYMEACRNFKPVFRFFFMEKFLDSAVWFQRRLAYTRSVATNSIVGYILGLGDRHVMNILVDCNSAELIHIDLGVAFEQGHILPTPETVPFRLTRDIVDGMGITGVEGVFRRCCEKTMEVMRGHQESLMTIVQVLLYDPLSEWTLSPHKVCALQARQDRRNCDTADLNVTLTTADTEMDMDGDKSDGTREPVNKLAERVLLRLQQKLQGLEDGVTLSVAGQVNHLIQTAWDPRNLSRLFHGWQPYI